MTKEIIFTLVNLAITRRYENFIKCFILDNLRYMLTSKCITILSIDWFGWHVLRTMYTFVL